MLSAAQGFTYNKFEKPNDWPKLKDTFDYDIRDNKLLGGNEHLYLSGPVTYVKYGNPTIIDGVITGSTTSNYVYTDANLPLSTLTSLEIVAKATHPSGTSGFRIASFSGTNYSFLEVTSAGKIEYYGNPTCYRTSLSIDNYNYVKLTLANATAVPHIYFSIDGTNWTESELSTISTEARTIADASVNFGRSPTSNSGSIDLKETYIKVNSNLWFYGKNYTTKNMVPVPAGLEYNNITTPEIGWVYTSNELVKGPVNYTKVGSPKIVDGIASSFGASDYLQLSSYSGSSSTVWEINTKFTTGTLGTKQGIMFFGGYSKLCVTAYNKLRYVTAVGWHDMDLSYTLAANTLYKVKVSSDGEDIVLSLYNEAGTLLESLSYTRSSSLQPANTTTYIAIGTSKNNEDFGYFNGSIDMNHTYIKVSGQPWFGSVSKFQEFILAPKGTMIGKDDTHTLNVVSKNNIGTVGYTTVGSPTIVDGVASGFSSSKYFSINNMPSGSFEGRIRAKLDSDASGYGSVFFLNSASPTHRLSIETVADSETTEVRYYLYDTTTSTNVAYRIYSLSIKGVWVDYVFSHNASTHETTIDIIDVSTGTVLATNTYSNTEFTGGTINMGYYWQPFQGSIDLNETYIKINDQVWFGTLPAEPKLVGPVDYTVVGSPTISNGVVSGFSGYPNASSYIRTKDAFSGTVDLLKIKTKITTGESCVGAIVSRSGSSYSSAGIAFQNNGTKASLLIRKSNNTDLFNQAVDLGFTVQPNTTYYTYVSFDGNKYSWKIEDASNSVLFTYNYVSQEKISNARFAFGANIADTAYSPWQGTIDLNETYIKVNGHLWFGKENWNPAIYDNNSIVELVGHKSDYSQYNELGINPIIATDSDEVGTYDVWIDDQKVLENQNTPNTVDWSKLALTTGYSITTPSSLKAHVVQIKPTNSEDKIVAFSSFEDSDESI